MRILPFRHAGDKNFWLDVIQRLLASGHEVEALSVDLDAPPADGLPIRHVPQIPVYFRPDARFNPGHRQYGGVNNYASKTTTLPIIFREIRRRRREFRPDVIHFADNFGPGMIGLRPICGRVPLTVSAPTYHRNRPLYDMMLLASFASFNVIVPFSDAYYRRLLELDIRPERIRRIRWGIDTARFTPPTSAERDAARARLALEPGTFVVMWTGFTQQTSEQDLHAAIRTAQVVLQDRRCEFVFCFKPEHFREDYRSFERPGLKVVSSAESFHAARTAADVFLSPILDDRSTAAPPLVWPEILAMGIPILTTSIPGTDEAVVDGQCGFTVRSPEEAGERLLEIAEDSALQRRLREGARRIAVERFSVDRATDEYVDMWSALLHQSR
ncbi:MAG TPA: glycosyltransferase family 4 protein [Thermoplasmata archaeon]|nr:glycosyltransferase family 4 protein [Thermoplasmata archaeon]